MNDSTLNFISNQITDATGPVWVVTNAFVMPNGATNDFSMASMTVSSLQLTNYALNDSISNAIVAQLSTASGGLYLPGAALAAASIILGVVLGYLLGRARHRQQRRDRDSEGGGYFGI